MSSYTKFTDINYCLVLVKRQADKGEFAPAIEPKSEIEPFLTKMELIKIEKDEDDSKPGRGQDRGLRKKSEKIHWTQRKDRKQRKKYECHHILEG